MADTSDATLVVTCSGCGSRLRASAKIFGTRQKCPTCGGVLSIPSPTGQRGGTTQRPPLRQQRFPCRMCESPILVSAALAGRKIDCPTCFAPNVVPEPSTDAAEQDHIEGDNQYDVWPADQQPTAAQVRASQPSYVSFDCSLCQTRLTATEDQVGEAIRCPDCGAKSLVPAPVQRRPSGPRADELRTEYPLESAPGDRPQPKVEITDDDLPGRRPTLPKWPLLKGVLTFPLRPGPLLRIGLLTFWLLVLVGLSAAAATNLMGGGYSAFTGVLFLAASIIVGVIWVAAVSGCWITILTESSDGNDRIERWPDLMFVDWMFDGFFVVMAGTVSVVPGWGISAWAGLQGAPSWITMGASLLVCFPVVLLSMLEINSPAGVLAPMVVRSLFRRFFDWTLFYLQAAIVVGGTTALVVVGLRFNPYWVLAAAPVAVAVSFWYFRLLGRLGWCIAEASGSE